MSTNPLASVNGFLCNPWRNDPMVSRHGSLGLYTDADLAVDMNALSFAERQAVEEDIHGVADVIEQTPHFVAAKIEEMKEALGRLTALQRQAWDRVVFLRPALAEDLKSYLMFLRARRFRAVDAAGAMAAYFQAKRDLFGEDLLIHRITWNDLMEAEQSIFRSGAYQIIPGHDRTRRGVLIVRTSRVDCSLGIIAMARCMWYVHLLLEDNPAIQQKGVVSLSDYRGQWLSSPFQIVRLVSAFPVDAMPLHHACAHFLHMNTSTSDLIQTVRRLLPKDLRMRIRSHFGSSLEIEYALKTFGIDVSRQLYHDDNRSSKHNEPCDESIEEDIRRRQQLDHEWWRAEEPYRNPASPIALFPNS